VALLDRIAPAALAPSAERHFMTENQDDTVNSRNADMNMLCKW
jgi:hypothetical protein